MAKQRPFSGGQQQRQRCRGCGQDADGLLCGACVVLANRARQLLEDSSYGEYFNAAGNLLPDYVDPWPNHLALLFTRDGLSRNQAKAFFGHIRQLESAMHGSRGRERLLEFAGKVKGFAHIRMQRKTIPPSFARFIERNADAVAAGGVPALKAFAEHFQMVIAYCEGRLKDSER
jgi:hypothetical protein